MRRSKNSELSCLSESSISLAREKISLILGSQSAAILVRKFSLVCMEMKPQIHKTTAQPSLVLDSYIFLQISTHIFFFGRLEFPNLDSCFFSTDIEQISTYIFVTFDVL